MLVLSTTNLFSSQLHCQLETTSGKQSTWSGLIFLVLPHISNTELTFC